MNCNHFITDSDLDPSLGHKVGAKQNLLASFFSHALRLITVKLDTELNILVQLLNDKILLLLLLLLFLLKEWK